MFTANKFNRPSALHTSQTLNKAIKKRYLKNIPTWFLVTIDALIEPNLNQ